MDFLALRDHQKQGRSISNCFKKDGKCVCGKRQFIDPALIIQESVRIERVEM